MASTVAIHNLLCISHNSTRYHKNRALSLNPSQLLSPNSLSRLKREAYFSPIKFKQIKPLNIQPFPRIFAVQSNFVKVAQTAYKIGKDGIEAGTKLVPDSIPRPVAKISVAVVAGALVLFVLKSILSTALFALAVMGLIYFTYIALNKDEGPKRGEAASTTSTDDSLEEARRIMEKYK